MWFLRRADKDEEHQILHEIELLLSALRENAAAGDEDLANVLMNAGVERRRAQRLVVLVPIAFGRDWVRRGGVRLVDTIDVLHEDGTRTSRRLDSFAEFRVASSLTDKLGKDDYTAFALHSAEIAAVNNSMHAGSDMKDIRLTAPATWWDIL